MVIPPSAAGKVRAQVEVTDDALAPEVKAATPGLLKAISGKGLAKIAGQTRLSDSGEKRYTVLAFDESGSFGPYWPAAFDLARAFAQPRPNSTIRVVTFGRNFYDHGLSPPADALTLLNQAQAGYRNEDITLLKSYIKDSVKLASDAQPLASGGVREVIVFTDGGDESTRYSMDDVANEARDLGVRVHTVVFYRNNTATAQQLDDMKRLAELTGADSVHADDPAVAKGEIEKIGRSFENMYWLNVSFCGLPPQPVNFDDTLFFEANKGGARVAWTDPATFHQLAVGPALLTCVCEPPCGAGMACVDGICKPLPPGLDAATPPDAAAAPPPPPPPVAPPPPDKGLLWWLSFLIPALLAALLLLLLSRRRQAPPPPLPIAPVPAPIAPPPVAPVAAPVEIPSAAPSGPWQDPFLVLPDTRLVPVPSQKGMEPFYRITKSPFTVGGAAGEVDLALDLKEVSGRHATFQLFKGGNLFVIDEQSRNGTYVDGKRLTPGERVQLRPGQLVGLSTRFSFRIDQPQPQDRPAADSQPLAPAPPPPKAIEPAPAAPPVAPAPPAERPKSKTIYEPIKKDEKK